MGWMGLKVRSLVNVGTFIDLANSGIYQAPRCGDGADSSTSKSPGKGASKKQRNKKAAKTKGAKTATTGKRERAAKQEVARKRITTGLKETKPRGRPKGSKNRSKK